MKQNIQFLLLLGAITLLFFLVVFGGVPGLQNLWTEQDPLLVVIVFSLAMVGSTFLMGTVSGDYSWVDRLWSTAPVLFVWFYGWRGMRANQSGSGGLLVLWMFLILVTLWGARLTFNFARRGGYTGHEDYRWSILRNRITSKPAWHLFSFGFISLFQIGLFILFTLPVYDLSVLVTSGHGSFLYPSFFWAAGTACLFFLGYETLADQQQWDFHRLKKMVKSDTNVQLQDHPWFEDTKSGFLQSGLFRFSRHPNYFGELGFWWSIYLFRAVVAGEPLHWVIIGPILLTVLFIGSTLFTEGITASKYPGYSRYQGTTSPIIPWIPGQTQKSEESILS